MPQFCQIGLWGPPTGGICGYVTGLVTWVCARVPKVTMPLESVFGPCEICQNTIPPITASTIKPTTDQVIICWRWRFFWRSNRAACRDETAWVEDLAMDAPPAV